MGAPCNFFMDEPLDHIVRSNGTNLAVLEPEHLARLHARPLPPEERRPRETGIVGAVTAKLFVAAAACNDALLGAGEVAALAMI